MTADQRGHAHLYPHGPKGWEPCRCGAVLAVAGVAAVVPLTAKRKEPADIGDGFAAQTRQAQDYAELLLRERAEAITALAELREDVERLRDVVRGMPEQAATRSRDHGRGYALACRDVAGLLDRLLGRPS